MPGGTIKPRIYVGCGIAVMSQNAAIRASANIGGAIGYELLGLGERLREKSSSNICIVELFKAFHRACS